MKHILFAADHAGWEMKNELISYLSKEGYECTDLGTNSPASVHYPEYADALCEKLIGGGYDAGILVCGTGIGMSIAANRHKGVRAALCTDEQYATLAREHNDANVLCLGARFITFEKAAKLCDVFLTTDFLGGRHKIRTDMLDK